MAIAANGGGFSDRSGLTGGSGRMGGAATISADRARREGAIRSGAGARVGGFGDTSPFGGFLSAIGMFNPVLGLGMNIGRLMGSLPGAGPAKTEGRGGAGRGGRLSRQDEGGFGFRRLAMLRALQAPGIQKILQQAIAQDPGQALTQIQRLRQMLQERANG